MAEKIGEALRQWRAAQGLTLGGLALKTGLAVTTLSRWEAAKRQPNLRELEVALDALKVTPQQRIEALLRLETPSAALRLRELCGEAPPTAGDLLRAMRSRLHLTQAAAAARIGVTQTMLAKWERSEDWPSVERLTSLCHVLRARPNESVALLSGRLWLLAETRETPALESAALLETGEEYDLHYLTQEGKLWREAQQSSATASRMVDSFSLYARTLLDHERVREAGNYGNRALQKAQEGEGNRENWAQAALSVAEATARAGGRASGERAFSVLRKWVQIAPTLEYRSWMLGKMGMYLAQAGRADAALKISDAACRTAEESDSSIAPYFRMRERAQTLAALNHYEAALRALERVAPLADGFPDCRLRHWLLQSEYLMALDRRVESAAALAPVLTETANNSLNYLRPQAERLAQRLYGAGGSCETP